VQSQGRHKARFLRTRFAEGYTYIGDAAGRHPGLEHAAHAVTVNPSRPSAPGRCARQGDRPSAANSAKARDYLRVMRPHQWLKNLLVFAPMLRPTS
jgi:hypothetical protein